MKKLLILTIAVLALSAADDGAGLDPHGRPAATADVGCGIDPNGCNRPAYAGTVDPNGRPST